MRRRWDVTPVSRARCHSTSVSPGSKMVRRSPTRTMTPPPWGACASIGEHSRDRTVEGATTVRRRTASRAPNQPISSALVHSRLARDAPASTRAASPAATPTRSSQARAVTRPSSTSSGVTSHTAKPPGGASPSTTSATAPTSRPSHSSTLCSCPRPTGSAVPGRCSSTGDPATATPARTPPRRTSRAIGPSTASTTKPGWSRWATITRSVPRPTRRFPTASRRVGSPASAARRSTARSGRCSISGAAGWATMAATASRTLTPASPSGPPPTAPAWPRPPCARRSGRSRRPARRRRRP